MKRKPSGEYRYKRPSVARRTDRIYRQIAMAFGRALFRESMPPPFPFLIPSDVELPEDFPRPGAVIRVKG